MMNFRGIRLFVLFILSGFIFAPNISYADCDLGMGNGTRPEGKTVFNTAYQVVQTCKSDGQWHALGPINCPAGDGCSGGGDTTPDAFSFTNQTGVATSTQIESDIVQITGTDNGTSVSITGDGSPEYRICTDGTSDANCDGSVVQNWTTSGGSIDAGEYLQLRLTSNAANSTMNSATVTVGTGSDLWNVTTTAPDPCAGSPSLGDTCADGTIYAGLSPDGNEPMYTTPADAGPLPWNNGNSSGYNPTNQTSTVTGETNTNNIITVDSDSDTGGTQPHQAAQYCADLNAHSHSDWYLPAKNELNVLYTNKNAGDLDGSFNESGTYPAGTYWSSSEAPGNRAWDQKFIYVPIGGNQNNSVKYGVVNIRCVRKD